MPPTARLSLLRSYSRIKYKAYCRNSTTIDSSSICLAAMTITAISIAAAERPLVSSKSLARSVSLIPQCQDSLSTVISRSPSSRLRHISSTGANQLLKVVASTASRVPINPNMTCCIRFSCVAWIEDYIF